MQPSSLIFLVVIAIWAAYLLQHWLGRREHLSTARSVDRFSESMRILDRKAREHHEQPARAAVSSTRLHPQVTVKRAEALLAATPAAATAATAKARTLGGKAASGIVRRRLTPAAATRSPIAGRATRGVVVLAALALTVLTGVLALVGIVGWRVPLVALAATVAAQWWLRRAVRAEHASRRRNAPARPVARRGTAPRVRVATARPAGATAMPAGATAMPVELTPTDPAELSAAPETVAGETLYDLAAIEAAEAEAARAKAEAEGWRPVPVPPPTYTLKAKATPVDDVVMDDEDDDVASPFGAGVTDLGDYSAERARLSS